MKRRQSLNTQTNSAEEVWQGDGERQVKHEPWWNERLTSREIILSVAGTYLAGLLVFWLFYRSFLAFLMALPFCLGAFTVIKKKLLEKKNSQLRSRFLDLLGSLESSLEAGASPEGAMYACLQNLSLMYKSEDIIIIELSEIIRKLYSNRSLEEALTEFAEKTGDEDIKRFANVFAISKRSGGDLLEIIRSTLHTMAEKEEVLRQIKTLISAKRMEAAIMAVMPPGIILYFQVVDGSFLLPLYSGLAGRVLMTALLCAYAGCLYLMLKITDIKV